jgi:glycosyltransferase involved in cell wall biosynthesis
MVFPITSEDEAKLRLIAPQMHSTVISAGVDTRSLLFLQNHISNRILFLINYDWPPNKESLEYYIGKILPNVTRLCPGVITLLVGKGTEKFKRNAAANNIEVVGFLKNLNDLSALGSIAIVPLRIGSGMRIKILELMAMGRVVITTSIGAEGIEAEHGKHLVISDDPYEFAASVAHYLGSPEESARIGENARKLVEEKYSWDIVGKRMYEVYTSLVHASH